MPSLGARILGVLLYMIPWSASIIFGNHLYIKYPFTQIIQIPAIPIIIIERSLPFGNLLLLPFLFAFYHKYGHNNLYINNYDSCGVSHNFISGG